MITSNLERSFHGLNIAQHNYKIFLDESGGNIGKLKHTPNDKKGSNFNRTISSHIGVPPVFVLGGIAQISNANLIAPDWRKLLHLQNKELKFSKIGKNFFNKLGSKELRKVLEWINENNLCIHFALYDWVYFYDVDIIDSALIESDVCSVWKYLSEKIGNSNRYKEIKDYQRKVGLDKQSDDIIYLFYIKELLHDFIINNLQWFLSEIYNNHYKKIDNQEKTVFLDNLYNMIKGSEKYKVLEFFLEKIDRNKYLSFIYDKLDSEMNEDKTFIMLVEDMSPPYQNYLNTFPLSEFYFDKGMEHVFIDY